MNNHRLIWAIAAIAAATAVGAFALRQTMAGVQQKRGARAEREDVVGKMIDRLDMDPRVRAAATRTLVESAARYCADPALASAETCYAEGLRAYYGASDMEAAKTAFTRASTFRPAWAWPVNGLALVAFSEGNRGEAERLFTQALQLDPTWSRPHSDMVILYRRAGDLNEAFNHAQAALEIEPNHPVNHFNYGVMLDELGRHTEARRQYELVLDVVPNMPQAAYNLACGYARQGDLQNALPYLAKAIFRDPEFGVYAQEDPDFDPIRTDPAFVELIGEGSR